LIQALLGQLTGVDLDLVMG